MPQLQPREVNVPRRGRTLGDIHVLTGLRANYISRVLRGKFPPRLDKLKLLARALDMSVHELAYELQLAPKPPRHPKPIPAADQINRSALSRATGIDLGYISRIVRGKQQPAPSDLAIIAAHFESSMDVAIKAFGL